MKHQIGFCEWVFPHTGPTTVKIAAELGTACIQVDDLGGRRKFYPLSDKRIQQEYLELAAQYGISLVSVGANAAGKGGELVKDINGPDGAAVKQTLRQSIQACADMKIPMIMLPFFWKSYLTEQDDEKIRNVVEVLKYAGTVGADLGVLITMESILPASRIVDIMNKVNSDWVKVFYDIQNPVHFCGADNLAEIRELGSLIAQVHIKDGDRDSIGGLPIGCGDAQCAEAVSALKQVGYHGPLLIESDYNRSVHKAEIPDLYERAKDDLRRVAALQDNG